MICKEFRAKIYDFVEDQLDSGTKEEMKLHLEECEECRAIYERKISLRKMLELQFDTSDVLFESQRKAIMKEIDNKRYKGGILIRLARYLKRLAPVYASVAVIIIAVIIINPFAHEKSIGNEVLGISDDGKKDVKVDGEKPSTAVGANVGFGNIDEVKVDGDKGRIKSILEEMKGMPQGAVPWEVVYADEENIAFYNYVYLLLYRYTKDFKGIYSAVDLRKLRFGGTQGSSIISIEPSPNGQYYVLKSSGDFDDGISKNIYLVDMFNRKSTLITGDAPNSRYAFSRSSMYFLAINNSERIAVLHNLKEGSSEVVDISNIPRERLDYVSVADNKDIFLTFEGSKGCILRHENYEKPYEMAFEKATTNFLGANGNGFAIFKDGAVYEYREGYNKKIKDIGKGFSPSLSTKEAVLFSSKKSMKVYDLTQNKLYEFEKSLGIDEIREFDRDYNYIRLDLGRIFNRKGEEIILKIGDEYPKLSTNSIISVSYKGSDKLGEFNINKYDMNGNKTVLFDSTK